MLRTKCNEIVEYKEIEIIERTCIECGESHNIDEMSLYSDGFRCKRCSIEKDFYDSLSDEEMAELFEHMTEDLELTREEDF